MSGFVYFILCEPMEAVKIGFSKYNPSRRLRGLQTGCPSPLKLACYFPGTMDEEKRLHIAFWPLSIRLEWFRFEGKLRDFVWYIRSEEGAQVSRDVFENALHDVLMQGLWYPDGALSEEAYLETGNWEPFRKILWLNEGPWEE